MSVSVKFCNCNNARNVVNKTFTQVDVRDCSIVYPCDVLRPTLKVLGTYINANSVEGFLGRNYWITGQTLEKGANYVTLAVDVLSSWKNSILNTSQYVARSETDYNLSIPDNLLPIAIDNVPKVERASDKFGANSETFILGVTTYDYKPIIKEGADNGNV